MATLKVSLVAARPELGNTKANLATVIDAIRREDADLIVFPEMFLSGYGLRDGYAEAARWLREHDALGVLRDAARSAGTTVVVGGPREGAARGILHNAAFIAGPTVEDHYDKVYLPTFSVFEEDLYFREGTRLPVFETPKAKLGLAICYDLFFPEVTKTLALLGADVIVCGSASPTISRKYFEAIFPARAIETTTFLLYTNLVGLQDTTTFWGGAQAWGPRGDLKAKLPHDEPGVLRATLDLAEIEDARQRRPALRDTRADVLRALLDAGR